MSVLAMPCLLALLAAQAPAAPADATPGVDTVTTADDPILRLGARVARLRTSVDGLAADVGRERASLHEELASLERRRRELEERLAQERLTAREVEARLEAHRAAREAHAADADTSLEPVRAAIARLRVVQARVPFRLHARRERLAVVERSLSGHSPSSAAAALWPIVRDEAQLLREHGRVRQAIVVDGAPVMAELAHVGPLVWWRSSDGRGGFASPLVRDTEPRFIALDAPELRQRLTLFFEAWRRGPLTGTWLMPSPLIDTAAPGGTP